MDGIRNMKITQAYYNKLEKLALQNQIFTLMMIMNLFQTYIE